MPSSPKEPKDPINEVGDGKPNDEKGDDDKVVDTSSSKGKKVRNTNGGYESGVETSDDEMSYLEWKEWKKKQKLKSKKKKPSYKIVIESSDDSDSDERARPSRSLNMGSSSKAKRKTDYRRVSHDYRFQIPSEHNASIHMGKPPYFDGTGYNQ